jgi:hypothetical protein
LLKQIFTEQPKMLTQIELQIVLAEAPEQSSEAGASHYKHVEHASDVRLVALSVGDLILTITKKQLYNIRNIE